MGFRVGAYCKVWSIEQARGNFTKVKLSVSKKQQDGTYATDFNGFCMFIGNAHAKAAMLKGDERIKLGDVDVSTVYNKDQKKEYVNYKVFDFEFADGNDSKNTKQPPKKNTESNPIEGNPTEADDCPF